MSLTRKLLELVSQSSSTENLFLAIYLNVAYKVSLHWPKVYSLDWSQSKYLAAMLSFSQQELAIKHISIMHTCVLHCGYHMRHLLLNMEQYHESILFLVIIVDFRRHHLFDLILYQQQNCPTHKVTKDMNYFIDCRHNLYHIALTIHTLTMILLLSCQVSYKRRQKVTEYMTFSPIIQLCS